jgi:hypothetical protein
MVLHLQKIDNKEIVKISSFTLNFNKIYVFYREFYIKRGYLICLKTYLFL